MGQPLLHRTLQHFPSHSESSHDLALTSRQPPAFHLALCPDSSVSLRHAGLRTFGLAIPLAHALSLCSLSQFSSVQSLSRVRRFANPWTAARQASLSFTNSWSLLSLMPIELVMPSNHLILCHPLLPPSVFPTSGSFPVSQLFESGSQSIGLSASASVLPMNTQD